MMMVEGTAMCEKLSMIMLLLLTVVEHAPLDIATLALLAANSRGDYIYTVESSVGRSKAPWNV